MLTTARPPQEVSAILSPNASDRYCRCISHGVLLLPAVTHILLCQPCSHCSAKSYTSLYFMGKASASTTLQECEEVSPALVEAITQLPRSTACPVCAGWRAKSTLFPRKDTCVHSLGFFISKVCYYSLERNGIEPQQILCSHSLTGPSAAFTFPFATLFFLDVLPHQPKETWTGFASSRRIHWLGFLKDTIFPHLFWCDNIICTKKALQKSHFSNSHIPSSLWALTQIISLFYLALVNNLFMALCLPSLSAHWLCLELMFPAMKDIRASQSQLHSSAAMHCCPVFAVWNHGLSKTQPHGSLRFGKAGALIMFPSERARLWGTLGKTLHQNTLRLHFKCKENYFCTVSVGWQLQALLTNWKTNRTCFHPPWVISFKDALDTDCNADAIYND